MPKWSHAKEDGRERLYAKSLVFCLHLPAQDVHDLVTLHNDDVDALTAERDRLAAENAELRKERDAETVYLDLSNKQLVIDYEQALKDLTAANAALDEERAAYSVLLESHEIILDALTESDATLDALREAVPIDAGCDVEDDCWFQFYQRSHEAVYAILYPQPAAMAEENDNG